MNKTLISIFLGSLLTLGCAHTQTTAKTTTTTTAPAPTVVASNTTSEVPSAPSTPPEPIVPVDPPENAPHTGPFSSDVWSLSINNSWLGREEDGDLIAINVDKQVKLMLATGETENETLQSLVVKQRMSLMSHGVKTDAVKYIKVDGVRGATYLSHQGTVNAYLSIFTFKHGNTNVGLIMGCGGKSDNKDLKAVCQDAQSKLHFIR